MQQDTVYALRDLLRTSDTAKAAVILRIFQALEAATVETDNTDYYTYLFYKFIERVQIEF